MVDTFCKIEDSNKNQYILTDKYKQPLVCSNQNSCNIKNISKTLNDPSLNFFIEYTKIPCALTNLIDKSKINFNIYDIATINKDIIIKNTSDIQLTVEQIENNYELLYFIDKDNSVIISEITDLMSRNIELSYELKLNLAKSLNDYNQKLFTKEEASKKFVYFHHLLF